MIGEGQRGGGMQGPPRIPTGQRLTSDEDRLRDPEPIRHWLTSFFVRRVDNRSDVDDLVQDVFVRIAGRTSPEPVENLPAYVLRTATSVLADRHRRRKTRRHAFHVPFDPDFHGAEEVSPERLLSGREDLDAVAAALLSLPERTRTIFLLRRVDGMRHQEIATRFGISVSAVEKHMVRAIRHLTLHPEVSVDA